MGIVYEAIDTVRDARVALKRLERVDPTALHRFKREFRARADVVHPNLVALHELIGQGDRWFFTMELLDGVDVLTYARAQPEPDLRNVRAAFAALVEGLAALHDGGLVHRDVKPSNVLVCRDGRVVLLDFGLVARTGVRDSDRVIIGTPAYLAPEVVGTGEATPAADWYAVGVMLYEVLTSRLPFDGTALQLLMDKAGRDAPEVRVVAPDAPADLAALATALLRREPAERPGAAEILHRLGAQPSPRPRLPDAAPFVGRRAELDALDEAFALASAGKGAMVIVSGESGIGKTRLIRHFLDDAQRRRGALVLEGRCYERESVPYQGVDSLIDALASHLATIPDAELGKLLPPDAASIARLFPVLRRLAPLERPWSAAAGDEPQLRRRALVSLRALLARLAARQPVVLFVDDLQWSDTDTAGVLADLTREPDAPAVLWIAAQRSDAGVPRALAGAVELEVAGLSAGDARALARSLTSAERAAEVAREARGHPLFTLELARRPEAHGGTLREVIADRLDTLPAPTRRLLEMIAAAGRPLPLAIVERAAALPPADAGGGGEEAATRLRTEHLIRSHGVRSRDQVEPYHDQVRAAVLAAAADRLPDLHRGLATALEASGHDDPEALAHYWRGAGELRTAARHAEAAATRAAETLAFARAAELYAQAIALSGDPQRDHELRLGHARALASAGHGIESARAFLAAVPGAASAIDAVELQRLAAEQLLRCGQMRDGAAVFEQVFRATGVRFAPTPRRALLSLGLLRARIRLRGLGHTPRRAAELSAETLSRIDTCWAAASGIGFSDVIRGAELQARGLLLALKGGEPFRVCRALAAEACFRSAAGGEDDRKVMRIIARAEALAREIDSPHGLAMCGLAGMLDAYMRGHYEEALALAGPTIARFRSCTGAYWEATSARHLRHWALAYMGRLEELRAEILQLLDDPDVHGDIYASNYMRTGTSNLIWLAADRADEAAEQVDAAEREWPGTGFQLQDYNVFQARVHHALYAGDGAEAQRRIDDVLPQLRRSQFLTVQQLRIEFRHLRACAALARGDGASVALAAARAIDREKMRWGRPMAAILRAAACVRAGDRAAAAVELRAAISGFDAARMAAHAEIARLRLGELLGGEDGDRRADAAIARLGALGIARADRFAAMWAPR